MFQYLQDLKNNDKSILSTFNFYRIENDKPLSGHFLKKWLEEEYIGDENIRNWNFEEGNINEDQFVQNIANDSTQDEETYGTGIFSGNTDDEVSFIARFENRNQISYYYPHMLY